MRKRLGVGGSLLWLMIIGSVAQPHAQLPGLAPPPLDPAPVLSPRLEKLDPLVQQALLNPWGRSDVIVCARDAGALIDVALLIEQTGGILGRQLSIIDGQVANVANASLSLLSSHELVTRIASDRAIVSTMQRTGATIGATMARQVFGYDGAGITVAVIDSGVTSWHDDLTDASGVQRVDRFVDLVNQHTAPYDDNGHGTHVAGIIAGNGFDSNGARMGVAPAARLVVLKALNESGTGRISDVIAAFDDVLGHRDTVPTRVVNVSVGAAVYESYNSDLLTLAAKRVVDAGIVVVAAAGNHGRRDGVTQYGGVTAPGNAPWVLTVGASSHAGTVDRADDSVAGFSSRGPTAFDRAAKPDLVAPGVGIESLSDPNSAMYASRASYLLDGTVPTAYRPYLSLSGTSQATPIVSGTVALMLQANPALTPNAVKAILQYTAQPYAGYDAMTQGAGFLNAYGAIELARFFAAPTQSAYPSRSEWSQHLIWGSHRVWGGFVMPDANAWSPGVAWGGSPTTSPGTIAWGVLWSAAAESEGGWVPWGVTCVDPDCTAAVWTSNTENVVWESSCDGAECPPGTPPRSESEYDTVVWGTWEDDTVVWGTTDVDAVVWGTCEAQSC